MNSLSWHNRSVESADESPSPKRSALDMSGYSMRLQQNAETKRQVLSAIIQGESMFDFLKRRKRFAIEQRISKNSRSRCQPPTDRSLALYQTLEEPDLNESKHKKSIVADGREEKMSTLSSKRVTFRQSEATTPQQTGRSFFDIVSPFKRRLSKLESYASEDISKENVNVNSVKKLKTKEITVQKQSLLRNVEKLASRIGQYSKNVGAFRSKGQSLYLETLAVLADIESDTKDKQLRRQIVFELRKLDELRREGKTADRLFAALEQLDVREEVEEIKRGLSNHLNIMEAQLRKQYESQVEADLRERESTHREMLADLQNKLKRSTKDMEALQNILSKQNSQSQESSAQSVKHQRELIRKAEERSQCLESQIEQLQQENEKLLSELDSTSANIKELTRQNRTLMAEKNSLMRSFDVQKEEIASRKEKFLLEEMTKLKKQFQLDMDQLTDLFRLKETELLQKISVQQTTVQNFEHRQSGFIKAEALLKDEIVTLKGQLDRHKAQNEQLIRQLHHSTDEACLYWTALKDIKTVSTRLGFFGKLARFYEDISFRDSSFR